MKNKVFEINVDFETKSAVDTDLIKIVKGDYNSIEFDLKMDKTDYKRAVLFLVKPSKKNFVVDIANSKAIFTEKNTFDEVGIYYYGVVLYGTNSKLTTSTKGKIQVVEGYNEDNEDITGDENYPILDKLIEEVTDLKDKINASLGVMNKTFKEVTYDPSTGVMSFKNLNNEVTNINLPLSLLISSASYDNDNKKIVLTLANNDTIDIPILDLVSNYYDDKINANKEHIASSSNELYRLKTDVLETGESSGNNIHLEDSAWSEMQEISVDGVCKQNTTTGKNLLDLSNLTSRVWNGITITRREDGSYSFSGTATDSTSFTLPLNLTLSPGTYTFSFETVQGFLVRLEDENNAEVLKVNDNKKSVTVTLSEEKQIKRLYFWASSGSTYNKDVFPQLEQGSQATNFEPYTGCQPSPSPNYPQNISVLTGDIKLTSCGKNLFDSSFRKANGTLTVAHGTGAEINGIFTLKATGADIYLFDLLDPSYSYNEGCGPLIEIPKNNSGKLFFKNTNSLFTKNYITQYDENKKSLGASNISSNVGYVTIKSNAKYCSIRTGYSKSVANEEYKFSIMVSINDIPYEPYQSSSLNTTIPENEFVAKLNDTYKDTLNVVYKDDGHYHLILKKMVGKVELDGVTNYVTSIDLRNGNHTVCNYVNSDIKILESETIIIANKLIGTTISKTWNGNILYSIAQSTNGHYLQLCLPSTFTTSEQIKNWLKDNPTIIYYILETPYEIDLGIVDQLLTFDEITNIFTDSNLYPVINVKYYRNFIKTIQNLQVNNDTLKNELVSIENRLTALENANTSAVNNNPTAESEVTE